MTTATVESGTRASSKRQDVIDAAGAAFARSGFLATSIDAIAADASVSSRTIYNHFSSKENLFATVIGESSQMVAEAHESIIATHLNNVVDIERSLVEFAIDWLTSRPEFVLHEAIVRRINAEADHFPPELYEAWQEAGPIRVRRALAARLSDLRDQGLLAFDDAEVACRHLIALITPRGMLGPRAAAAQMDVAELAEVARSGIRAYLHGHLPRTSN